MKQTEVYVKVASEAEYEARRRLRRPLSDYVVMVAGAVVMLFVLGFNPMLFTIIGVVFVGYKLLTHSDR